MSGAPGATSAHPDAAHATAMAAARCRPHRAYRRPLASCPCLRAPSPPSTPRLGRQRRRAAPPINLALACARRAWRSAAVAAAAAAEREEGLRAALSSSRRQTELAQLESAQADARASAAADRAAAAESAREMSDNVWRGKLSAAQEELRGLQAESSRHEASRLEWENERRALSAQLGEMSARLEASQGVVELHASEREASESHASELRKIIEGRCAGRDRARAHGAAPREVPRASLWPPMWLRLNCAWPPGRLAAWPPGRLAACLQPPLSGQG